ncbi:hypothetical protein PIB30_064718 [Stylosanthes scabra]|uniref:Uncharacterized protein n=1 Tax=Stylosanthes scabra TaxID=79078 RepID=A0ABU6ULB1_9FABA|nr:hypothetical protein [Stylosanthes scabra]
MAENLQGDQLAEGAVQIPRELPFIYRWVINDVLGTPSALDQEYLDELKLTGVLFGGGGDLERRYRVEAARRGDWGNGRFPSYWSDQAGFEIVPATYQRLNADQRDTADILGPHSESRNRSPPVAAKSRVVPEGESTSGVGKEVDQLVDISSTLREEELVHASTSPKKRVAEGGLSGSKRPRVSEEGPHEFSAMDRSFDASHFIGSHLLGPQASETLRDYDSVESVRWAEWTMLRLATMLKSIEPRLTVADEVGRRNEKLQGDLKVLNLQKVILEGQKAEAVAAQLKAEEDLRLAKAALEALKKENDEEVGHLKRRELELISEGKRLRGLVAEERVRADLSEVSMSKLQKQCEDLTEDAKADVAATEGALKAQLAILAPDFDTDQISFFKDIVDGKVVDPSD